MRKKDMIKRTEKLFEMAKEEIVNLKTMLNRIVAKSEDQQKVINFLTLHNKDEVVISNYSFGVWWDNKVEFVYYGELKISKFVVDGPLELIKNDTHTIILKSKDIYYQIEKESAKYVEIPKPAFVSKQKELKTKKAKKC